MQTIIWDYNGTIIDDTQYCLDIELDMLKERGMNSNWTIDDYRELFCFPVKNYYYKLGYTFENESYDDISIEFNEMYDANFDTLKLMDGFIEFIEKAIQEGYQNVILSASRSDKLKDQCDRLGIAKYFVDIMGTDNILAGSKVDMAKNWMTNSDVNPKECIYIGDTTHDVETAEAIGIENIILVPQGHQSKSVLEATGKKVVSSLKDIKL